MGSSMRTHLGIVELLATAPKPQVKAIIQTLTKDQINAICEGIINIRYGNVSLEENDKKKLHRKRVIICKITTRTIRLKLQRKLLEKDIPLIIFISKLLLAKLKPMK